MPIAFDCACGKGFRVDDGFAGKRTKCPGCGAALTVPAPPATAEDEAFRLLAEAPDAAPAPRPPAPPRWDAPAPPKPGPPPPVPKPVTVPAAKTPKRREPREEWQGPRIALSPGLAGGLASMAGGAAWFAIALANNRIAIFAPVVFCFGLVAVVRGLLGRPED